MKPETRQLVSPPTQGLDFIRTIVAEDIAAGRHEHIVTRFPPEPNGFMHIGHASSVCLNFGIAEETGGVCHLRFDDTNPETEDVRYVDAMIQDVRWLGFDWGDNLYFASDYFPQMYQLAEHLIREGKAYVDSLNEEEIREFRGTVTEPGRPSPFRDRSVEENLDLFRRMQAGEFEDGAHVLRAKLDLASPNMRLRDPLIYRIRHAHHYRSGDQWRVYPLYDYAHPIEDAIEGITHSICTLEFVDARPFYDWIVENIPRDGDGFHIPPTVRPRQYEFARRNLDYTVMSKRKLLQLVREGYVTGWDDPRMPTIAGLRRRGFTPQSIRTFAQLAGVGKIENRTDIGKLEFAIRDELNQTAPRVMAVLRPLKLVITNYPEDRVETLDAPYFPRDVGREGSRPVPFSREVLIDADDFTEDPPAGYHRLAPGREVRLRYAYVVRCLEVVRDEAGNVTEVRCVYDESTRGGRTPDGRAVPGTIQWVSARHAVPFEARLYDRLFSVPDPEAGGDDFTSFLNPESLVTVEGARVEPSVLSDGPDTRYQFERLGYFWRDPVDSTQDQLVFNRIVTLRDTWTKQLRDRESAAMGGVVQPAATKPAVENRRSEAPAETPPRSPALEQERTRLQTELDVGAVEAEILTRDEEALRFFEQTLRAGATPRLAANWLVHEVPRAGGARSLTELRLTPVNLAELLDLVESGEVSSSAGRQVLQVLVTSAESATSVVERLGLRQLSDPTELASHVDAVIGQNPDKVAEFRAGRTGLLAFFVGQVMKRTGGRGNPELIRELAQRRLDKGE